MTSHQYLDIEHLQIGALRTVNISCKSDENLDLRLNYACSRLKVKRSALMRAALRKFMDELYVPDETIGV